MYDEILALYSGEALRQVQEYLAGRRTSFSVPAELTGTDFQLKVWRAMMTIPYGKTRTYKQLAAQIGHPHAYRAVGTACGKNKWPILVPCHRVVASNGLGGFALGLKTKKALLKLEAA
jgi:methylated-DNA-[protein]-cysteine S-methyltransferase